MSGEKSGVGERNTRIIKAELYNTIQNVGNPKV